jgi:hypothetical protein
MKPSIFASAVVLLGLSFGTMGCSRAAAICDLVCECEHCNDQNKVESCNQLGTAEEVADVYDCSDKWDAYMDCYEQRGTCDAKESRFSTRNDAGDNLCQDEADALDSCIDAGSAHDGTSGAFN